VVFTLLGRGVPVGTTRLRGLTSCIRVAWGMATAVA